LSVLHFSEFIVLSLIEYDMQLIFEILIVQQRTVNRPGHDHTIPIDLLRRSPFPGGIILQLILLLALRCLPTTLFPPLLGFLKGLFKEILIIIPLPLKNPKIKFLIFMLIDVIEQCPHLRLFQRQILTFEVNPLLILEFDLLLLQFGAVGEETGHRCHIGCSELQIRLLFILFLVVHEVSVR
jgi:hypothetical protein